MYRYQYEIETFRYLNIFDQNQIIFEFNLFLVNFSLLNVRHISTKSKAKNGSQNYWLEFIGCHLVATYNRYDCNVLFYSVQILAEEAHSLDAFDSNAAKAALDEATAAANAAGDDAAKAEAQIAVEVADALVKALA